VSITIEILPEAQRMVDAADERWVDEHGFLTDNPLLDEILHASDLLRTNPQIGVVVRRARPEIRRLLLHSGWHIYYRSRLGLVCVARPRFGGVQLDDLAYVELHRQMGRQGPKGARTHASTGTGRTARWTWCAMRLSARSPVARFTAFSASHAGSQPSRHAASIAQSRRRWHPVPKRRNRKLR
jgi:hypothetical protein